MTLRKRYEVIMEHITVTDEMRRRILANIQSPASLRRGRPTVRKMLAAAACLVLILAGAALLPAPLPGETVVPRSRQRRTDRMRIGRRAVRRGGLPRLGPVRAPV